MTFRSTNETEFNPENFIILGSEEGNIILYDIESGLEIHRLSNAHYPRCDVVKHSPYDASIFLSGGGRSVYCWVMSDFRHGGGGEMDWRLENRGNERHRHKDGVNCVEFLEEDLVLSGGLDSRIYLWYAKEIDLRERKLIVKQEVYGHVKPVRDIINLEKKSCSISDDLLLIHDLEKFKVQRKMKVKGVMENLWTLGRNIVENFIYVGGNRLFFLDIRAKHFMSPHVYDMGKHWCPYYSLMNVPEHYGVLCGSNHLFFWDWRKMAEPVWKKNFGNFRRIVPVNDSTVGVLNNRMMYLVNRERFVGHGILRVKKEYKAKSTLYGLSYFHTQKETLLQKFMREDEVERNQTCVESICELGEEIEDFKVQTLYKNFFLLKWVLFL